VGVVCRAISTYLVRKAGFAVSSGARTGAVTLMDGARPVRQRTGGRVENLVRRDEIGRAQELAHEFRRSLSRA
jgi:hypothetical protein